MNKSICWAVCLVSLAPASCVQDRVPSARATPSPAPSEERDAVPDLRARRIPLDSQPATLVYDRGTLWVGGSRVLRVEDDRVVDRLPTNVSRVKLVRDGPLLWATGGGDGGLPDGTLVAYDAASGTLVERRVFPNRSPYGIDAAGRGVFVALFHGDLVRITDHGTTTVSLSHGLTQVLVAHGKVWVSAPQSGKVWRVAFDGDRMSPAATDLRGYPGPTCPQGLANSRNAVWVADVCAKKVWLLDPRSGAVVDRITGIGRAVDLSIDSGLAWIVSFRSNLVTVLSEDTLDVVARSHAGKGAIAIAARHREAWVANHEDYSLTHLTLRRGS